MATLVTQWPRVSKTSPVIHERLWEQNRLRKDRVT